MNVKITEKDKIKIGSPDDLYEIMQRILLRENRIDREKEHFWIIGLNMANTILYVELVSMGSVRATTVEPTNVYRVAVLKGATSVVAVHNHPSGKMTASDADKDITDRLIQVGKILDIQFIDHLIISTERYMSFVNTGLMHELEQSLKYVPSCLIEDRIRKEVLETKKEMEKTIKLKTDRLKAKTDKLKAKTNKIQETANKIKETVNKQQATLETTVTYLLNQNMTIAQIAAILKLTPKEVEQLSNKAE